MRTLKLISLISLFMLGMFIQPSTVDARIKVGITIRVRTAPPALPYYDQPYCPADGYLWIPGYWAYSNDYYDYYWVPGVWVRPPHDGYLWTPSYWGFYNGFYGFHNGYWGRSVGYYGGVDYGYGYGGSGYYGGRWSGNHFQYNTAVVNVNRNVVRNVYTDRTHRSNNTTSNRPSYNGPGGVRTMPNAREKTVMRETHARPTAEQTNHQQTASKDRSQFKYVNKGQPATTSVNKVGGNRFNSNGQQAAGQRQQAQQPTRQQNQQQVRPQQNNQQQQQQARQQQQSNQQQKQQVRQQQQNNQQQNNQQQQARQQQQNNQQQQQQARQQQQNNQQQQQQQQQNNQQQRQQQAPQQQNKQENKDHER